MPMNVTLLRAALKADLLAIFSDLDPDATAEQKAQAIGYAIADRVDAHIRTATVTTAVTVASVSGVTTGPGVSGPGAGTGTGALT